MYTQGAARKSKREKEKEAAEAKRKEEEENAARAYAEFLDEFQGERVDRKKSGAAFVKAGQEGTYAPAAKGRATSSQPLRGFERESSVCRRSCSAVHLHLNLTVSPEPVAPFAAGTGAEAERQACYGLVP